jgi:hypothetical protein
VWIQNIVFFQVLPDVKAEFQIEMCSKTPVFIKYCKIVWHHHLTVFFLDQSNKHTLCIFHTQQFSSARTHRNHTLVHSKTDHINIHSIMDCWGHVGLLRMHFGVLSSIFRVLGKPMPLNSKKSSADTSAWIYLHNFISKCNLYMPNGTLNTEKDADIIGGSRCKKKELTS